MDWKGARQPDSIEREDTFEMEHEGEAGREMGCDEKAHLRRLSMFPYSIGIDPSKKPFPVTASISANGVVNDESLEVVKF